MWSVSHQVNDVATPGRRPTEVAKLVKKKYYYLKNFSFSKLNKFQITKPNKRIIVMFLVHNFFYGQPFLPYVFPESWKQITT